MSDYTPEDGSNDWVSAYHDDPAQAAAYAAQLGAQAAADELRAQFTQQHEADAQARHARNALDIDRSMAHEYGDAWRERKASFAQFIVENEHLVPDGVVDDPNELLQAVDAAWARFDREYQAELDRTQWDRVKAASDPLDKFLYRN